MIIDIPRYKHIKIDQQINFVGNKVCTLIGGNGSGKSTLLESIFNSNIDKNLISFSSGQNELYTKVYNDIKRETFKKLNEIGSDFENINRYYFNSDWVRILIFFASSMKDGFVRKYLSEHDYIDRDDYDDLSSKLVINFELPKYYIDNYQNALKREETEPEFESVRKTYIHQYLEHIIEKYIEQEFDFDKTLNKQNIAIDAKDTYEIFDRDFFKIFTFISLTNNATKPIFSYQDTKLIFKNGLEFQQLSDGEYQLLSIYALIDLFDSESTIFLLDEVDSHLHYINIIKLWSLLENVQGKVITTTHQTESIILNDIENIEVVENGKLDDNVVINRVLLRLEYFTSNDTYQYKLASKLKHIALVENYTDWFIFKELCRIKIDDFDEEVFKKVQYINCSSGYETRTEDFGNRKKKWYANYQEIIKRADNKIENLFMICDRDNLPLADIKNVNDQRGRRMGDDVLVKNPDLHNHGSLTPYLLSWRRKQIENYLLSKTMLEEKGILDDINHELPAAGHLQENNPMDIKSIQDIEIKDKIKVLYTDIDGKYGVCYNTLKEIIGLIPADEISEDIVSMYSFIKQKVEN